MGLSNDEEKNEIKDTVVIELEEELVSFIVDVLEYGDEIESEEDLKRDKSYEVLFSLLKKILPFTAVIEEKYVDRNYRDSYYMHFSSKHSEYSRFCKRLFLFKNNVLAGRRFSDIDTKCLQKDFVGTIVIRPLREGKVGRCLINPYFILDKKNTYLRFAKYSATIFGKRLYVNAFPFSMQDGETTTCAEVTILNMMDYFGRKYSEYKSILPSEIAEIVEKNDYQRVLPTKGLRYPTITKIFSEYGFYPRLYSRDVSSDMSHFKHLMHYYIESGIPVAVGSKVAERTKHSIVCVGHGKIDYNDIGNKMYTAFSSDKENYIWLVDSADLCNHYITMDDGKAPYKEYEWIVEESPNNRNVGKSKLGEYEPDTLMVPLYKRMYMEAQDAYDICTSALASNKIGIQRFCKDVGTIYNPIVIRLFMCSSRNFKYRRITRFSETNEIASDVYRNLCLPRFVWVCEIYDRDGYKDGKAIGEIVVDATSSSRYSTKSVLLFHYPHWILPCKRNGSATGISVENENFIKLTDWEAFCGYDHNLFQPESIKK